MKMNKVVFSEAIKRIKHIFVAFYTIVMLNIVLSLIIDSLSWIEIIIKDR